MYMCPLDVTSLEFDANLSVLSRSLSRILSAIFSPTKQPPNLLSGDTESLRSPEILSPLQPISLSLHHCGF
ncbi:hypothetical protein LWI28_020172 [Acer negundo]|uniref:Uncharacterized protein n=1 Tax=Acer negundo TaxID=4023 RepID=A0AAD5NK64_ACENE|nr:hypothetical protein LWI28_020172 [Acer negundo]